MLPLFLTPILRNFDIYTMTRKAVIYSCEVEAFTSEKLILRGHRSVAPCSATVVRFPESWLSNHERALHLLDDRIVKYEVQGLSQSPEEFGP